VSRTDREQVLLKFGRKKKVTVPSLYYVLRSRLLLTNLPPDGLEDRVTPFERSAVGRGPPLLSSVRSLPSGRLRSDVILGAVCDELLYPAESGALDGPVAMRSFPRRLREFVPRARF